MIDVEQSRLALGELRHARRHNHREVVHWIDALYRVYISALLLALTVLFGAGLFGEVKLSPDEQQAFMRDAVPWLGLAFAAAVAIGLRSGARGGPLTLEAATVQHELQAPIPYRITLREPAVKQLRFMAFTGAAVGATVGVLAMRRFPENSIAIVAWAALAFALVTVLSVSVAMIASGQRLSRMTANGIALLVLAWSAVDVLLTTTTSPLTLLARMTFNGVTLDPLTLVTIALVAAALIVAMQGIGGISIDDARRRAGLVSQLRFAVTLQDIRTVVLLRRQLAQETPRAQPWIRTRRGGRLPAIWQRDWRSYLRYPVSRLARMLLLTVVAGVCLGLTWTSVRPAFLIAALALYLAAYDAVEPLAQEIDHPTRWDGLAGDAGKTLLTHLPASLTVMTLLCALAGVSALLVAPPEVVFAVLPVLILPVAAAATAGAALSTVMGSPNMSKMMSSLGGSDVVGLVLVLRLAVPPALTVAALAPMFALGTDINQLNTARMSDLSLYSMIAAVCALIYIRYQRPARI